MSRKETYNQKKEELLVYCKRCRSMKYQPSIEQCDECTIGRRLRMLETEYSDVTGWSHLTWKTK